MTQVAGTVTITAEEFEKYQALKEKQEREEQAQLRADERKAYREIAQQTVDDMFPLILEMNQTLKDKKKEVFEAFETIIAEKCELFSEKIREGQRSHSFTNASSTRRIIIGRHMCDGWDSTVDGGIELVRDYVQSLAKDKEAETLVKMLLDLLAKDKEGNLKAEKVLQLSQYAQESDSDTFKEGVRIIQESYRPELTKLYLRAEQRGKEGKWENVPLNVLEA